MPSTSNLVELVTSMQRLQRTVKVLVDKIAKQGKKKGKMQNKGPQVKVRQTNQLPSSRGLVQVSSSQFITLHPLHFSKIDALKDPQ